MYITVPMSALGRSVPKCDVRVTSVYPSLAMNFRLAEAPRKASATSTNMTRLLKVIIGVKFNDAIGIVRSVAAAGT
jgi:hypothetical protein